MVTPLRTMLALPVILTTWPTTLAARRVPAGLGVLNVPGQCVDEFGIERRSLRRDQRRTLVAVEVIRHHHAMEVVQMIRSEPDRWIVSGKQQMRVRNCDCIGGLRKQIDLAMGTGPEAPMQSRFATKIQ